MRKVQVLAVGVVSLLVLSGVAAMSVSAQDGQSGSSTQPPSTQQSPRGEGQSGPRQKVRRQFVIVSAETIGIKPRDLAVLLRDGQSVADVAEDEGVELSTVTDALQARADARIDEAVAAGRIDEAKAGQLKERAATRIDKAVHHRRGDGPTTTTVPAN
jgi:hypothetical protein